jgi:hypothetical protein
MLPAGRVHDDKQDLPTCTHDEKEQFSDSQDVYVFQNTLFSDIEDLSVIQQQEVLFSGGHDTQKLAQDLSGDRVSHTGLQELLTGECFSQCPDQKLFQMEQASKQHLLPEGRKNHDRGIFPEDSVARLPDKNTFTADSISNKTVPPASLANQTQAGAGVSGGEEELRNVEDMISVTRDTQDIFPRDHVTRRIGQNVLSGCPADQQCVLSEGHAAQQCVFSGDRTAGQEALTESRLTQIIDVRPAPRQLDMGKHNKDSYKTNAQPFENRQSNKKLLRNLSSIHDK